MFESGSWEERAHRSCLDQAISLAGALTLPVTARSLTRAEAVGADGGRALILYLLTLIFALIALGATWQSRGLLQQKLVWSILIGFVTFGLYALARTREKRRSAYVDPEIVVEAADGGVTVRNPAGSHALPGHALRYEFVSYSHDSSVTFLGIKLQTPLGILALHEEHYVGGRKAAAAIVVRAEREKVEGGILRA